MSGRHSWRQAGTLAGFIVANDSFGDFINHTSALHICFHGRRAAWEKDEKYPRGFTSVKIQASHPMLMWAGWTAETALSVRVYEKSSAGRFLRSRFN